MKKQSGIIEVPGMGQNLTATVLEDVRNYTGDYVTDIVVIVDESTSILWRGLEDDMRRGIANIKTDLQGTKIADSIRVCVLRFGKEVPKKLDFVPLDKMDTSYKAWQYGTKLYEAICVANNLLLQHIEAMEHNNVYVTGLVIVATDGRDEGSENMYNDAVSAIKTLHGNEIDFQYICIGDQAIDCAHGLGLNDNEILSVSDTDDPHKVRQQWAMASASAKAASQRAAGSSTATGASAAAKFSIE